MIGIHKEKIEEIPVLTVVNSKYEQEKRPVIVYFHGITSAKEHNLDTAYLLAEKGFRVILPDSLHHGEREYGISADDRNVAFWEIILQNLKDLFSIKTYLEHNDLLLDGRIGVAGTSMGGITTAAALTQFAWIKAAVIFMGSPKPTLFAEQLVESYRSIIDLPEEKIQGLLKEVEKIDLSRQIEVLKDRPLLLWHGDKDQVVPFDHSYSFYQEAKNHYQQTERIQFIREENRDHKVSRSAKLEGVHWLEKYV